MRSQPKHFNSRLLICMSPRTFIRVHVYYDSTIMPRQPYTYIKKLLGFPLVQIVLALIAKSVSKYSRLIILNNNKLNFTTKAIVFFFVSPLIFFYHWFQSFPNTSNIVFTLKISKRIKIKKKKISKLDKHIFYHAGI
jgi:hypothetical protein